MALLVFPSRFSQAIDDVRRLHPLPIEQSSQKEDSQALVDKLLKTEKSIEDAASSLSLSERQAVFPAIALAADPSVQGKLVELASCFTGWSQFETGWFSLQQSYPCRPLQNALASLWRRLLDQENGLGRPPYFLLPLPQYVSLELPDDQFLQESIRLVTEDFSRKPGVSVDEVFLTRHIVLESVFGSKIFLEYLRKRPDTELLSYQPQLRLILPRLFAPDYATLIVRVLVSRDLTGADRSRLLRELTLSFGSHQRRQLILSQLRSSHQEAFQSWYTLDTLRTHYRAYPVKQDFMMQFLPDILQVTQPTPATVYWQFPGFVVVDTLSMPDKSFCYTKSLFDIVSQRGFTPEQLGAPDFPVRQVANPSDAASLQGVFELSFVGQGLLKTKQFLQIKLGRPSGR